MIIVTPTKNSGNSTNPLWHSFSCNGIPCNSTSVTLHNLLFGLLIDHFGPEAVSCDGFLDSKITITDTSVVALRGSVWIANTADYNGDSNRPCPVIGAKVCALDYYSSSTVACDTTAADGLKNGRFVCN